MLARLFSHSKAINTRTGSAFLHLPLMYSSKDSTASSSPQASPRTVPVHFCFDGFWDGSKVVLSVLKQYPVTPKNFPASITCLRIHTFCTRPYISNSMHRNRLAAMAQSPGWFKRRTESAEKNAIERKTNSPFTKQKKQKHTKKENQQQTHRRRNQAMTVSVSICLCRLVNLPVAALIIFRRWKFPSARYRQRLYALHTRARAHTHTHTHTCLPERKGPSSLDRLNSRVKTSSTLG